MAIFTNLASYADAKNFGYFESSMLKTSDIGNLWDVVVRDENDKPIDMQNGIGVKVGDYTGNGLQERYGTVAKTADAIAVTGDVTTIKDAFIKAQKNPLNWFKRAGEPIKTYEVVEGDVFAVGLHQFGASKDAVKKDAYVVVDGEGGWTAQATDPGTSYGFVGKVHSIAADDLGVVTVVRILCVRNKDAQ